MIMSSPPYYGLRNYGGTTEKVWGGLENCEHEWVEQRMTLTHENRNFSTGTQESVHGEEKPTAYIRKFDDKKAGLCAKCGAWRGQLGLEPTWTMYVDHINMICEEARRVLKPTGSMYLVLGDTYSSMLGNHGNRTAGFSEETMVRDGEKPPKPIDYRPKCLMGVPWRIAFKLIENNWILRNDIIWHKNNPMPSSVKDRLAQTYEHIFHFVKAERYYYSLDAIRMPHQTGWAPFKLRVRDFKSGKGGVSTAGPLKANEDEVQSYSELRRDSPARANQRIESNLAHFIESGSSGNYDYGGLDSPKGKHHHPSGKNPGDTVSIEATLKSWGADSQGEYHGQATKDYTSAKARDPSELKRRIIESFKKKAAMGILQGKNPGDCVETTIKIGRHHGSSLTSGRAAYHAGQTIENHPLGPNPGDSVESMDVTAPHYWTKETPDPRSKEFIRTRFPAWASTPGHPYGHTRKFEPNWDGGDYITVNNRHFNGHHFAVYPEDICLRPILSSCPPNGVVMDPMCGSGTTLVVAKRLGRHYIGVDINPDYVEIARKRLSKVDDKLVLEGDLSNP
jgi:DNA modification methylase